MSLIGGSTILAAVGSSIAVEFRVPGLIFAGLVGEFKRGSNIGREVLDCCLKPLS